MFFFFLLSKHRVLGVFCATFSRRCFPTPSLGGVAPGAFSCFFFPFCLIFNFFDFHTPRFSNVLRPRPAQQLRMGSSRFVFVFCLFCSRPSKTPRFRRVLHGSAPPGSRKRRCTASAAPPGHNTHPKKTSSKTHHLQHPAPPATTQTQEPTNEHNQTSQTTTLGTDPPPARKHRTHTTATPHTRAKNEKTKKTNLKLQVPSPPWKTFPRR